METGEIGACVVYFSPSHLLPATINSSTCLAPQPRLPRARPRSISVPEQFCLRFALPCLGRSAAANHAHPFMHPLPRTASCLLLLLLPAAFGRTVGGSGRVEWVCSRRRGSAALFAPVARWMPRLAGSRPRCFVEIPPLLSDSMGFGFLGGNGLPCLLPLIRIWSGNAPLAAVLFHI